MARALHRNRSLPHARYLQLATVRADGRPANRTVVFRGFLDGTNVLRIVTDRRSQKADQIGHSPWGEACWYFPSSREQFRLAGALTLIGAEAADPQQTLRQQAWQALSEAARCQFTWPEPGAPRQSEPFSQTAPADPPVSFCLLLLDPDHVDHLELRGDPQDRSRYWQTDAGDWQTARVNP